MYVLTSLSLGGGGMGSWVICRVVSSLSAEYHHSTNLNTNSTNGTATERTLWVNPLLYTLYSQYNDYNEYSTNPTLSNNDSEPGELIADLETHLFSQWNHKTKDNNTITKNSSNFTHAVTTPCNVDNGKHMV